MSGGGGDGGDYARQMEQERQQRVAQAVNKINEVFGGKDHTVRQDLYNQQKKAVADLNSQEVRRQFDETARANRFGLARAGLLGGSADVDSQAELARRTDEGLMKATGLGEQSSANLREADERTRNNLISMAQSGIDTGQAAQMALAGMDVNARNAASERSGSTIGNLFSNLAWAYLYGQQMAGQNQGRAGNYSSGFGSVSPHQRYGGQIG